MEKISFKNIENKIVEREIVPIPRWHFLLKRRVFWLIASASVLLGGIAVAIITFVFFDHDFEARNYINQSLVDDILLTIPYIWLVILSLLVFITRISFRHTKNGYRHGIFKVVGITLVLSILLGLILNAFDLGGTINEYFNETIPYYDSLVYTSKDAWSQPEKGLLGGVVISIVDNDNIVLNDFKHNEWKINLTERQTGDASTNLQIGDVIKIVGKDVGGGVFQAEQVFVWQN